MTTPSSRVLFPKPTVDPGQAGKLNGDPPRLADPLCLVQASGAFPRGAFAMVGKERPVFDISGADGWRLDNPKFTFDGPEPGIASGGAWTLDARSRAICPRQRSRSRCPMTC